MIGRTVRKIPLLAAAMLAVLAMIALGLAFVWRASDQARIDREAEERITAIQQSRAEATYEACLDQNKRNEDTVALIDARIAEAEKTATPEEIAQLRQSREFTVLLINALAPHRDCEAVVRERYGFVPKVVRD